MFSRALAENMFQLDGIFVLLKHFQLFEPINLTGL